MDKKRYAVHYNPNGESISRGNWEDIRDKGRYEGEYVKFYADSPIEAVKKAQEFLIEQGNWSEERIKEIFTWQVFGPDVGFWGRVIFAHEVK